MEKIRVGLIDRSPAARLGLRVTLEKEDEIEIVGETRRGMDTGAEALRLLERASPDVFVLGLPLPDIKAIELIATLREKRPEIGLLIFSHWPHIKVSRLVRAGAMGVLLETDSLILLPEAIHTIKQGETWLSPKAQALDSSEGNGPVEILFSDNERALIAWLATGMNSQAIADQLGKGERTIRDYECVLKRKLGFDSRAKLVAWASQLTPETYQELPPT